MGLRLPLAKLNFKLYTDTQLIVRAQEIHNKMLANVATFPALDLPVPMVDLQGYIDDYQDATVAAIKGTKAQTTTKQNKKTILKVALKSLADYVNSVASNTLGVLPSPQVITEMQLLINLSGFPSITNTSPVSPINGIERPIVRRAVSQESGKLKILIRQYTNSNRNTLMYQVNYRTSEIPGTVPVPAGPWLTQTFTGQNQILLTDLTSGKMYDWQIAAVGGRNIKTNHNPPINYTPVEQVVII